TFIAVAQDITISPNQPDGAYFCGKPVLVAPNFTMESGSQVTGMKVSISQGYVFGEDELKLVGYSGPVTATWASAQGFLTLSGGNGITDYINAMRCVQYDNHAALPSSTIRILTFSLDDADFLPETGHFYRFISSPRILWTTAKMEAESAAMKYHGLQGYLATITSAVENAFIQQKTKGVGWIGATDQGDEGNWRWVTGPEGLANEGAGITFWRGTGYQAKTDPAHYGPVNGAYQNWNRYDIPYSPSTASTSWEPNNSGGNESYAHITYFANNPSESLKWNDLPNGGSSGDYIPAGYLIEYGGMPNDPQVNLTSSMGLFVYRITFGTDTLHTTCQGVAVHLNQTATQATYVWRPAIGLSNPLISDPIANPDVTTLYTVVGKNGACRDSATYRVVVKPAPVSQLKDQEDICIGQQVALDPGSHANYLWSNGSQTRSITVSSNGLFRVLITGSNGCQAKDSVQVVVHQFPKMDLSHLDTLICGSLAATLKITSDKGSYQLTNLANAQLFQGTSVTVSAYGHYPFKAHVTDPYGCPSDTSFNLNFHRTPKVDLSIDESTCYGYNLQATYVGDADIPSSFFTWVFGGDTISHLQGKNVEQIPLGVNQSKRDLQLTVTEGGCPATNSLKDILVIPDLKLNVRKPLLCQPETFEFSATNTEKVVLYEWDWGDGKTGTGKNATHHYDLPGKYGVTLKVTTDKGCENSATIPDMVFAAPVPTAGFSLPSGKCLPSGIDTLGYSGTAGTRDFYYWDLGQLESREIVKDPGTSRDPLVFSLIAKPLAHLSLHVISEYGCKSDTARILVQRAPIFSFSASDSVGCAPLSIDFQALAGDPVDKLTYDWDFGDEPNDSGSKVSHTYQKPGLNHDLKLKAISSLTGCSDSLYRDKYVIIHPDPIAGFVMDHPIVYNDSPMVTFTDQSKEAVNYFWDFGDGEHSREKDPIHSYGLVGKRKVIQTVYNQFDCQDTTVQTVLVAFSKIFAPNAFSPNAPNPEDRQFLLSSEGIAREGYHLTILSRWNDKVFECHNEVKGWDGKMPNGTYAPAGNYIWLLECFDFLGRPHKQSGSLTLIF
ncbi:MAG: PKD domain-containing protein, partial [Marinilabiliales bacterium]|nr:PKD domain-containing protein [Marinilabiliales bacterium]